MREIKRLFVLVIVVMMFLVMVSGCVTTQKRIEPVGIDVVVVEEKQLEKAKEIKDKDILLLVSKIRNNYDRLIIHHKKANKQIEELTVELEKAIKELKKLKAEKKQFAKKMFKMLK